VKPVDDLLKEMVAAGASDLHIKAGSPPVMRVDGELTMADTEVLSPEHTKDYAASLMSDKQIRRFSENNEIDFAYSAPAIGRFRVNIFRQRGSISIAMRQVVSTIPSFEELMLPNAVCKLALASRGLPTEARKLFFPGARDRFKLLTSQAALEMLRRRLLGIPFAD
jgi:twitching motility protein PilT